MTVSVAPKVFIGPGITLKGGKSTQEILCTCDHLVCTRPRSTIPHFVPYPTAHISAPRKMPPAYGYVTEHIDFIYYNAQLISYYIIIICIIFLFEKFPPWLA